MEWSGVERRGEGWQERGWRAMANCDAIEFRATYKSASLRVGVVGQMSVVSLVCEMGEIVEWK